MKKLLPARLGPGTALLLVVGLMSLALVGCSRPQRAEAGYMLVFDYGDKLIPVEQLREADADACDDGHWHAAGPVVTLRGESLTDPNPTECGFGRVGELKYEEVPMPDDYQGPQKDPQWKWHDEE